MKTITTLAAAGALCLGLGQPASAADLSPASWPKAAREQVEAQEVAGLGGPSAAGTLRGRNGIVSATASPLAVHAGIVTLERGGNAADAATTVALTQVTTALGSYVSYAGIISLVYYEARTGKIFTLDAGYNSYLGETDPRSIPSSNVASLMAGNGAQATPVREGLGRKTLVPGYMAGLESMQRRFGKLKFADLFQPAIYYADHGLVLGPHLAGFFKMREKVLDRTPEGRAFFYKADGKLPTAGDRFYQPETARTLRAVAAGGSRYMYEGPWAQAFVDTVRRDGGKVTMEDMKRYRPIWIDPLTTDFYGTRVYTAGPSTPGGGGRSLITALNLVQAMKLEQGGPYWQDPQTFRGLTRVAIATATAPMLAPSIASELQARGIDTSPEAQLTQAWADQAASVINAVFDQVPAPAAADKPAHSDSLVVIDKAGNIVAMTHTINAVVWGDTGIVVGGIPLPDSAGFQQEALAAIKPGDRLPNPISPTVVMRDKIPVLATAQIGASLFPETLRIFLGVLGQGQSLETIQNAPVMLATFSQPTPGELLGQRPVTVPDGAYDAAFLDQLRKAGINPVALPAATARAMRGTVVTARLDPKTGERETAVGKGALLWGEAQ